MSEGQDKIDNMGRNRGEDGDNSEERLERFSEGGVRLRQDIQLEEVGRQQYVQRLRSMKGCCMFCSLLGVAKGMDGTKRSSRWHLMSDCRNRGKYGYFDGKKEALKVGLGKGGWIKKDMGCYRCGNPLDVCDGSGLCEYGDIIFPGAWVLFQMNDRWGKTLKEISGQEFGSESEWMSWVGTGCLLYGMKACQGARMVDWVLQRMIESIE